MTDRRGRGPDPSDGSTHLSGEDVERRLGGDAGLGGPIPERVPPPVAPQPSAHRPAGARRGGGLLWRDVLVVLVLLGFLGAGAELVLQRPTAATSSPSPGATLVAVASPTVAPPTTSVLPTPTPAVAPTDVIGSLAPEVTPTPLPTPTPSPAPGATPKPTPKPTPNPTPGSARLTVVVNVVNDNGGIRAPSYWTVTVSGTSASPSSFPGSASGTVVTVKAGGQYSVTATSRYGYTASASSGCAGTLAGGGSGLCTITENDRPAALDVSTKVVGGTAGAGDFVISVVADNASPDSHVGVSTGFTYTFDNASVYDIAAVDAPGYEVTYSTDCSGTGLGGYTGICTVTLTFITPP